VESPLERSNAILNSSEVSLEDSCFEDDSQAMMRIETGSMNQYFNISIFLK